MKSKILLLSALFIASFIFTACKDAGPDPTPVNSKYFGTGSGSMWTYSNIVVDTNGNETTTLNYIDTLNQVKDSTYLGKASYYMTHKFLNPITETAHTGNYFMAEDGSKLYVNSNFIKIFMPNILQTVLDLFGEDEFYKLADGDAKDPWKLMSIPLDNVKLPLDAVEVVLDGDLALEISRNKNTAITGTVCNTYTLSVIFNGTVPSLLPPLNAFEASIVIGEIDFYLAPSKGLIGIYSKPMQLIAKTQVGEVPVPFIPKMQGFKKVLINSTLK